MSDLRKSKLTVAEYLEIERTAEFKSEFFDGVMYPLHPDVGPQAMAGASRLHNRVKENLVGELFVRLKGGPCQTYSSDQRVKVEASGLYTYPDIIIQCGTEVYDANDLNTIVNPIAIIEVLSPSTERYDRGIKFRNYQLIPSLIEYIMVAQDEPSIERFVRRADGTWVIDWFNGLDATLVFTSVAAQIPLADIYAGVTFPETMLR